MGVDTKTYLSPIAKIEDVLKVIAILLGAQKTVQSSRGETFQMVNIPQNAYTVKYATSDIDKNGYITNYDGFMSLMVEDRFGKKNHYFMQPHYNSKGEIYFSGRSTPLPVALSSKLIDIFGGKLYSCDSDMELNKEVLNPLWRAYFTDNEDEGYIQKHQFFISLNPLTPQEIKDANSLCAYTKTEDELEEITEPFKKFHAEILSHQLEETLPVKPKKIMKKI